VEQHQMLWIMQLRKFCNKSDCAPPFGFLLHMLCCLSIIVFFVFVHCVQLMLKQINPRCTGMSAPYMLAKRHLRARIVPAERVSE